MARGTKAVVSSREATSSELINTACWVTAEVKRDEMRSALASQRSGLVAHVSDAMIEDEPRSIISPWRSFLTYHLSNPLSLNKRLKIPIPPRIASS